MMDTRRKAEELRDLDLLASSQAMKKKYPEELIADMAWRDYVQEALDRAVELRERREAQVTLDPVTNAPTASSHVVAGARERYLQWFCHAAGRRVEDAPPGFEPSLPETPECDVFDDAAWLTLLFPEGWLRRRGPGGHRGMVRSDACHAGDRPLGAGVAMLCWPHWHDVGRRA